MRADRLLSILMLLQRRGKLTARELADELEVAERTIYRDVYALSYSGVPIFTVRGPGGGIMLVESYRSDLTGLTKNEVRALFMLNIPPALSELGLDQELKTALRKLSATLPTSLRGDEESVRQRIHIDPVPWQHNEESKVQPHLMKLQRALWENNEVSVSHLTFVPWGLEPVQSILCPYGLVAKAENWFLVARRSDHNYVLELDRIQDISSTGKTFNRPADFNLAEFWGEWCQEYNENRPTFPVHLRVSPNICDRLSYYFKHRIRQVGDTEKDGWTSVEVEYEYLERALQDLLRFGSAIEVMEPTALRYSIKDYGDQIAKRYRLD